MDKKVSSEVSDVIKQRTQFGFSASEIADEIGVTSRTVVRWRKKLGISRHNKNSSSGFSSRLALAEDLVNQGLSLLEISRTVGISHRSLRKYFPGMSWPESWSGQLGSRDIAEELGVDRKTITRWRKKLGISRHNMNLADGVEERIERARELLDEGYTYTDVKYTVGLSWQVMKRNFSNMRLTHRESGNRSHMYSMYKKKIYERYSIII